jgi:hypothetical protein
MDCTDDDQGLPTKFKQRESTITKEDIERLRKQGMKSAKELDKILEKVFRLPNNNLRLY